MSALVRSISPAAFAAGMYALAENAGRDISDKTIAVFWDRLHGEMSEAEWRDLVARVIDEHEPGWATVAVLKRYLATLREERAADGARALAEAQERSADRA